MIVFLLLLLRLPLDFLPISERGLMQNDTDFFFEVMKDKKQPGSKLNF